MATPTSTEEANEFTVAFQGEKGAYSEQATFELLGRDSIRPVPCDSFDAAFNAVANGEVDLLMVPIGNSLGGTIHANCDLQLRNNLFIIAEHDFRVRHCLMALPGTGKDQITKVISHPQALAQCESYIRRLGVKSEPAYDTAGSAKLIAEGKLEGVAAICSELAASYYGLEILDRDLEDDSRNFTRFLLLRHDPVHIAPGLRCKTSIVFSMVNQEGALFKALSCFALRNIDLTKIESRPCKPDVMNNLERLSWSMGGILQTRASTLQASGAISPAQPFKQRHKDDQDSTKTRAQYRYLFYLDFQASVCDPNSVNAMRHLQEMTTFLRVLGCYPIGGALVGLDNLGFGSTNPVVIKSKKRQRVGILGFGTFGQFIAKHLVLDYDVFATSREDMSEEAVQCGVAWCAEIEVLLEQRLDIIIIAVSILSFETVVRKLSACLVAKSGTPVRAALSEPAGGSGRRYSTETDDILVVDVLSVKVHAKNTLFALLPESCDILCTHPMFGPQSGKHGWQSLPFVYERVRLRDARRCEDFLKWWEQQGCRMVDMTCELHDQCTAGSQFVTHFTGRVLARLDLRTTPINTKGYDSLLQLVDNTCKDSFDLFYALYKCNPNSAQQLQTIEDAIAQVSQQLRAPSATGSAFVSSAAGAAKNELDDDGDGEGRV